MDSSINIKTNQCLIRKYNQYIKAYPFYEENGQKIKSNPPSFIIAKDNTVFRTWKKHMVEHRINEKVLQIIDQYIKSHF